MISSNPGKILLFFAHPDDETSSCGGTINKYSKLGSQVYICTATNGNKGDLGTGDLKLTREELGPYREKEELKVLKLLGAYDVLQLGYDDQCLELLENGVLEQQFLNILKKIQPNIVITFGQRGFSGHTDHMQVNINATNAFNKYVTIYSAQNIRLFYTAMPKLIAEKREMDLSEEEKSPTIGIDISDTWGNKVAGLRMYKSQRDAQEIANMFETMYQGDSIDNYGESREEILQLFESMKNYGYTSNPTEYFHQYYPKLENYNGTILSNRF